MSPASLTSNELFQLQEKVRLLENLVNRLKNEQVYLVSETDVDWIDLTDGGATTLHSHTGGGWNPTVTTQTGTYTAADGDVVICNSTTAFTVTLPLATTANRRIVIKNINTGAVTVDGNGSETIDDQASVVLAQYDSITVISDGTEWWII